MKNLKNIITKFSRVKILVIGDLILDQYIWGSVERISPEAPVPVVWAQKRTYVPGGAANVAHNISALDGAVTVLGVIGKDEHGAILTQELKKKNIDTSACITHLKRQTILKTRVIAGHQQVVRVDWEDVGPLPEELNKKILKFIRAHITEYDALIIEDYGKGVVNVALLEEVIALARKYKKIITVDPKEDHFQYYRGVTCITPNRKELENAVRNLKLKDMTNTFKVNTDRLFSDQDVDLAACEILKYLDLDSILVTLGESGMKLFEKNGRQTHIPTVAQEVFDVSGAGDTVIGTFTLALASGALKAEAAYISNFAAGIVVGKLGTAVTGRKELTERMNSFYKTTQQTP